MPKNWRHRRLTKTRAVSGFCGETSQLARSRRVARAAAGVELAEEAGTAGCDDLAGLVHPVAARQNAGLARASVASVTTTRGMDGIEQRELLLQLRDLDERRPALRATPIGSASAMAVFCCGVGALRSSATAQGASSTAVGNLFARLRRSGQEYSLGRERQAEAADGGAAEVGILMQAHGDDGIGRGAQRLGEAQRQDGFGDFVVGGRCPSRSSDRHRWPPAGGYSGARRCCRLDSGQRRRRAWPAGRTSASTSREHQAVGAAGHAQPGRLSSCTTSTPARSRRPRRA